MILLPSFYQREDVLQISRELLGKILVTEINGKRTAGMIVEVEAYAGECDRASHAFGGRHTARTAPMFGEGGKSYVYLCYGIHSLFNVVTNNHGVPHAILIRGVEPIEGVNVMIQRRKKKVLDSTLTAGPGALSQALGITTKHTNLSLQGPILWIEDRGVKVKPSDIIAASRVGVAYAKEDALLPYRFYIKNNAFVSKAKGL